MRCPKPRFAPLEGGKWNALDSTGMACRETPTGAFQQIRIRKSHGKSIPLLCGAGIGEAADGQRKTAAAHLEKEERTNR